jgi:hypothetical protein
MYAVITVMGTLYVLYFNNLLGVIYDRHYGTQSAPSPKFYLCNLDGAYNIYDTYSLLVRTAVRLGVMFGVCADVEKCIFPTVQTVQTSPMYSTYLATNVVVHCGYFARPGNVSLSRRTLSYMAQVT